ncbi:MULTISPECIES: helix-turn-helix domain-containing protein [Bacillus]|uniref:Helix-turn-helix domain-containing protein n=3 Tax=Bacillaceae TaxID=186817 RepID=A0ABT9DP58_9BACI|nr:MULTISPECIES: helix-turn-helix domain-containing protein [Bacillus]MDH3148616.1 helix-turn-helix domain-containing protein [Bacillus subtilis]MDO8226442.1 helix-turn-helix domain-containing protein [Bacillus cabrialesii subsp. tritici]MDP8527333.1 helix-turn-helix domain-containing protein [Bacillus subtilis]MEC1634742.1 helix-turn-helix domain-containing protein [Bacillus mojavensis]MEC1683690.1 helix-turn-helix domain-containing protein [Bacillus mojavensis]
MYEDIMNKPALDVEDVQNWLGIGRDQAYALCKSGKFHTVKIGRRIKIPTNGFMRWFNGQQD